MTADSLAEGVATQAVISSTRWLSGKLRIMIHREVLRTAAAICMLGCRYFDHPVEVLVTSLTLVNLGIPGPTRRSACDSSCYTRTAIECFERPDSCSPQAEADPPVNAQVNSCRRRSRAKSGAHP